MVGFGVGSPASAGSAPPPLHQTCRFALPISANRKSRSASREKCWRTYSLWMRRCLRQASSSASRVSTASANGAGSEGTGNLASNSVRPCTPKGVVTIGTPNRIASPPAFHPGSIAQRRDRDAGLGIMCSELFVSHKASYGDRRILQPDLGICAWDWSQPARDGHSARAAEL